MTWAPARAVAFGHGPSIRQAEPGRCREGGQPAASLPRSRDGFVQAENPSWVVGAEGRSSSSFQALATHL